MQAVGHRRYTSRVYGTTGVLVTLIIAVVACGIATIVRSPAWLVALIALPCVAVAIILSTLTLDVYGDRVCWHFTLGAFRRCVKLSDITSVETRSTPTFGWGYRFQDQRRAWVASGNTFIVFMMNDGEMLFVNVVDAKAASAAIEPLLQRRP